MDSQVVLEFLILVLARKVSVVVAFANSFVKQIVLNVRNLTR